MKKEIVIVLILLLVIVSCNKPYDYRITDLKNNIIKYPELPLEIKDLLTHSSQYTCITPKGYDDNNHCLLYCLSRDEKYEIEVFYPKFGSKAWISYEILIDLKTQTSYRLEKEMPFPYIIFQNVLYVANEYNFINNNRNIESMNNLSFTCYSLK